MKKIIFSLSIIILAIFPTTSLAHEHQAFKIGDKTYEFTVGSLNEPIFIDDKTGIDLTVTENSNPVEKLNETLKVELSAGEKKQTFDLSPVYGKPGSYKTTFYPSVATTLSYRFFGTINNQPVNLTFTCNPPGHTASPEESNETKLSDSVTRIHKSGNFGCPKEKADATFPEPTENILTLSQKPQTQNPSSKLPLILGLIGTITGTLSLLRSKK